MKRIDFNDKFTKMVDEAYNEIIRILKTLDYDKEKGFNILNEEEGIVAERGYTNDEHVTYYANIEAIRVCPDYKNVLEYRLENENEWYSDWYEENLNDIFPTYDALCDTLNKVEKGE